MKIAQLFCLALVVVCTGCVSSGKYKDLEEQSNKTQKELTTCTDERTDIQKKLGITSTEKTQLESSMADLKKALADAEARKMETEKRLAEFKDLTAKFQGLVDAGKLSIKFQNGRMMLALSSDILFTSGSAQLSKAGKAAIVEVAGLLKDLQNRNFQIEGHTDNLPIHSKQFPSNWELASARAMSVLNTMLAAGFPPEHASAASYGSSEPVASNQTPEGRAENRRIAIVIVPDLSGLPGFDEITRLTGNSGEKAALESEVKRIEKKAEASSAVPESVPSTKADGAAPPLSEKTEEKIKPAEEMPVDNSPEAWPSPPLKSPSLADPAPQKTE